jgi:hypothetical protein
LASVVVGAGEPQAGAIRKVVVPAPVVEYCEQISGVLDHQAAGVAAASGSVVALAVAAGAEQIGHGEMIVHAIDSR